LPPATALGLEYDLFPRLASSGPLRVFIILNNLSRMSAGLEVKPLLPRAFLGGHVYVYDELKTLNLGYWVRSSCWTCREMLERLRAHVRRQPLPRQREQAIAELALLWEFSNLRAVAGTPEDALTAELLYTESAEDVSGEEFLIVSLPEGSQAKLLSDLFAAEGGLVNRQAGEELPAGPVAELLMLSGDRHGFERGQATSLLGTRLLPYPQPEGAETFKAGICPVVPVKLVENKP
jgi:hypothetical protein